MVLPVCLLCARAALHAEEVEGGRIGEGGVEARSHHDGAALLEDADVVGVRPEIERGLLARQGKVLEEIERVLRLVAEQ